MNKPALFKDRREDIWPGISKGLAGFLQQKWMPEGAGGSLQYRGFYFFLYSWNAGESWAGNIKHIKSGDQEKVTPPGCAGILDAKATLYEMMMAMKKRS